MASISHNARLTINDVVYDHDRRAWRNRRTGAIVTMHNYDDWRAIQARMAMSQKFYPGQVIRMDVPKKDVPKEEADARKELEDYLGPLPEVVLVSVIGGNKSD